MLKHKILKLTFCFIVFSVYLIPSDSIALMNNMSLKRNFNIFGSPFLSNPLPNRLPPLPLSKSNLTGLNQSPLSSQAMGPYDMAITNDGQYLFISMALPQSVYKIRLADFSIENIADLTAYFPFMEGMPLALDATGEKLFVALPVWRKLIVLNTTTMEIIREFDNMSIQKLYNSYHGHYLLSVGDWGTRINIINSDSYEITEYSIDQVSASVIQESKTNPDIWYVVCREINNQWYAGTYNYKANLWIKKISIPEPPGYVDLRVLNDGSKFYVLTAIGYFQGNHYIGTLFSINLIQETTRTIPIDGNFLCFELSNDSKLLFVGTLNPYPSEINNLLAIDTQTDEIVNHLDLGRTKFNVPYTYLLDLQIDPANSNILYATVGDANVLIKVKLDTFTLINEKIFNEASLQPRTFVNVPGQPLGYFVTNLPYLFEFDTENAIITRTVRFPILRSGNGFDVKLTNDGKGFISQGEYFLKFDISTLNIIGNYPLPSELTDNTSIWGFNLSRDNSRIYTVTNEYNSIYEPNLFVALNTTSFQIEAKYKLEGGRFDSRPYELPDAPKLYVIGGINSPIGPVVIHVISFHPETPNLLKLLDK